MRIFQEADLSCTFLSEGFLFENDFLNRKSAHLQRFYRPGTVKMEVDSRDILMSFLLFAYRKVARLFYDHQVRSSLDVVCGAQEGPGKIQGKNIVSHILKMWEIWRPCPTISPEVHSYIKSVRQEEKLAEQYLPGMQGET